MCVGGGGGGGCNHSTDLDLFKKVLVILWISST